MSDEEDELEQIKEELEKIRKQMKWSYAGYGGLIFWAIVVAILILLSIFYFH